MIAWLIIQLHTFLPLSTTCEICLGSPRVNDLQSWEKGLCVGPQADHCLLCRNDPTLAASELSLRIEEAALSTGDAKIYCKQLSMHQKGPSEAIALKGKSVEV